MPTLSRSPAATWASIDFTELPGIQKSVIDRPSFGKPIVTATQMLDT